MPCVIRQRSKERTDSLAAEAVFKKIISIVFTITRPEHVWHLQKAEGNLARPIVAARFAEAIKQVAQLPPRGKG